MTVNMLETRPTTSWCLLAILFMCGSMSAQTMTANQMKDASKAADYDETNASRLVDFDGKPMLRNATLVRVAAAIQRLNDQDQSFFDSGVDFNNGFDTISQHSIFINTRQQAIDLGRRQRRRVALLDILAGEFNMSRSDLSKALDGLLVDSSLSDLRAEGTGCEPSSSITCNPRDKYRSVDGTCNNLNNPFWGKSFTALRRFVPPVYDDGVSIPRARGKDGSPLPSPRLVSSILHFPTKRTNPDDEYITHMVMQFGQFLDHDITSTPVHKGLSGSAVTCCVDDLVPANLSHAILENLRMRDICFPIPVPRNDHRFGARSCLNFVRSIQVANAGCTDVPVEQLNQVTTYIDGSQIYGSNDEDQRSVRSGIDGLLRTSGSNLLPKDEKRICKVERPGTYCFKAGDERVNEQMGLSSVHTVWMREHNRIAKELRNLNPHWDNEQLFEETRKIVGALLQHITYDEFMPTVLGYTDLERWGLTSPKWGFNDVYDPKVDPSVRNSFATAAFRFGHSLVRSFMSHYSTDYQYDGYSLLQHIFGNTSVILDNSDRINTFLRGMTVDHASKMDRFLSSQLLDHLFEDKKGDALDLAALNMQRGRDHGIPGYNQWRKLCGLSVASTFDPRQSHGLVDHSYEDAMILSYLYRHPDDIDLFAGGTAEKSVSGGLVGPTFACIIGKQFSLLKTGDRFWYERKDKNTGFTEDQLNSIKSVSFARVMCENSNIDKIQPHVFWKVGMNQNYVNPLVGCWSLAALDLSHWKDSSVEWTNWSDWSQCFANFRHRHRTCPSHVSMCIGHNTQFKKCTKQSCNDFDDAIHRYHCLMNIADMYNFRK